MHVADDAGWLEEYLGATAELVEGARQKTQSESAFRRSGYRRPVPATLMENIVRHAGPERHATVRHRQGAVLCGVGRELMQKERNGQRKLRRKKNVRPLSVTREATYRPSSVAAMSRTKAPCPLACSTRWSVAVSAASRSRMSLRTCG